MSKNRTKVFVGMSGGVDSSVAAALLRRDYEVVGVFIKVADFSDRWGVKCTWREERREAMRAAAHLGLPLVTIDLSREYEARVVQYMIEEYRAGRTPNPDVMCNREIKFGVFYRWALSHGAAYVATGHYVRLSAAGKLCRAIDPAKDQSYFLWTLTPDQLAHCLFPIGDFKKSAVRRLAKKFGLPNAAKKDSQGLCFIGHLAVKDFLKKFIPAQDGEVVNERGEVIGRHQGVAFYTIGERHGFQITRKTPSDKPYYVVGKAMEQNRLIVATQGPKPPLPQLGHPMSKLTEVNWISGRAPNLTKIYQVQIRYHGESYRCRVSITGTETKLEFLDFPHTLTPGQSAVLYDGATMLGGGVISAN